MASVTFDVSDDLARRIRGAIASGEEVAVIFSHRARMLVEVRVQNVWARFDAPRCPVDTTPLTTAGRSA